MAIIKNYVAPKSVNPFAGVIDELIDAGEGAAYQHTAPTEKGEKGSDIATDKRNIQNAAREAGYSARVVESDDDGKGTSRIVVILAPKRVRRSKAEVQAEADAAQGE